MMKRFYKIYFFIYSQDFKLPDDLRLTKDWKDLLAAKRLTACTVVVGNGITIVYKSVLNGFQQNTIELSLLSKRTRRPLHFNKTEELNGILRDFNMEKLYPGVNNRRYNAVKEMKTGRIEGKIWRSSKYSQASCRVLKILNSS